MMDVVSAHHHPLKVPLMIDDAVHQDAHAHKGKQKTARGDEHAPPRPVRDGGAHQKAQPRELQQYQQHHRHEAGEGQQHQSSGSGHITY